MAGYRGKAASRMLKTAPQQQEDFQPDEVTPDEGEIPEGPEGFNVSADDMKGVQGWSKAFSPAKKKREAE